MPKKIQSSSKKKKKAAPVQFNLQEMLDVEEKIDKYYSEKKQRTAEEKEEMEQYMYQVPQILKTPQPKAKV